MTALPRNRSAWVSAAAGAAALTGMAFQRRFMKRIARDPERAALSEPPEGRPLQVSAVHLEAGSAVV